MSQLTIPALKGALAAYSAGPRPIDPNECVYVHTYLNGFQQPITYAMAAASALLRIEALESELSAMRDQR